MDVSSLIAEVQQGSRSALSRALTLVESKAPRHAVARSDLLRWCATVGRESHRLGVTGPPGAGKSTLIEALGLCALEQGRRVAVLAVDPSSVLRGGSILGDKTRMERLSLAPEAFIRPSASDGALGGVQARTREAVLVCEAAGYDLVIVETVGVGQSEVEVARMVDTFVLLAQPGAGDEVQGIKRGILELADLIAVTKADGGHEALARRTATQLTSAMSLMRSPHEGWTVPVMLTSALQGVGVSQLLGKLSEHREALVRGGLLDERRRRQQLEWFWSTLRASVWDTVRGDPVVGVAVAQAEEAIRGGAAASVEAERVVAKVAARMR